MESPPSPPAGHQPPSARHDDPSLPTAPLSGGKRPAPSLLPAFEPLSSSPGLPRPLKRQNTGRQSLPTPVPTSSTGILFSSSPPQQPSRRRLPASLDARLSAAASASPTLATVSERVPLSAVPAVELSDSGEAVYLGRSSNTSHVQLSANRLVSRVHVIARYIPASHAGAKIEIVCNGWNGLKLHSQGRTWELFKGDSFISETDGADVMVDVLDARVMIQWPRRAGENTAAGLSDSSSWDDSPSSSHARASHTQLLQSSPLRRSTRIASPESPTPASHGCVQMSSSQRLQQSLLLPSGGHPRDQDDIQIYEDNSDDERVLPSPDSPAAAASAAAAAAAALNVGASMRTEATASFSSDSLSEAEDHNPDEENDPVVHSFGPFGADISGKMASIMSKSPNAMGAKSAARRHGRDKSSSGTLTTLSGADKLPADKEPPAATIDTAGSETGDVPSSPDGPLSPPSSCPSPLLDPVIANHVVNQLAFSRLSSTPLSTIIQHLPAESRAAGLECEVLREAIESTPCIGIIRREGKDAAGKALESEYYYVPEHDGDEQRRAAVVDGLRKPSLRACRKQHKVGSHCHGSRGTAPAVLTRSIAILLEAPPYPVTCRACLVW